MEASADGQGAGGGGQMKFLLALSFAAAARKEGEAFALKTFEETRAMYHPIAEKMVAADLGV